MKYGAFSMRQSVHENKKGVHAEQLNQEWLRFFWFQRNYLQGIHARSSNCDLGVLNHYGSGFFKFDWILGIRNLWCVTMYWHTKTGLYMISWLNHPSFHWSGCMQFLPVPKTEISNKRKAFKHDFSLEEVLNWNFRFRHLEVFDDDFRGNPEEWVQEYFKRCYNYFQCCIGSQGDYFEEKIK